MATPNQIGNNSYFGDGGPWGVNIRYSVEDAPAGTAGSVKLAEEFLEEDRILVISGDALTDCDLTLSAGAAGRATRLAPGLAERLAFLQRCTRKALSGMHAHR